MFFLTLYKTCDPLEGLQEGTQNSTMLRVPARSEYSQWFEKQESNQ